MKKSIFKHIIMLMLCYSIMPFSYAQNTTIQWLTWEEAIQKSGQQKKKILVDVYTEWCAWCDKMDRMTFKNKEIAKYINENFYAVKLNAQQESEILYKDENYQLVQSGKRTYHQFAEKILNGRMSFPTLVFFDEDLDVIQSLPGYKTPSEVEPIITYFGKNHYKKMPWSQYQTSFRPTLTSIKE